MARTRDTTAPVRWEYKVYIPKLTTFTAKIMEESYCQELNDLGAEGWEVVAVTDHQGLFVTLKRPAQD